MSAIAERIAKWGKDDAIIMCSRVPIERSDTTCELCDHWIAALPTSRMKVRVSGWHLICKECFNEFFPEIRKQGESVKWGGRFRTEEEAQKVLPCGATTEPS